MMTARNLLLAPLFAIAMSLTGCGTDTDRLQGFGIAKGIASDVTGKMRRKAPPSKDLGLTRAGLASIKTPVDLVTIENVNATGVIAKIGSNNGVETWSSVDHRTLSMRNGVVVATRGLGADLMSASVPGVSTLASAGQGYGRVHVLLNGEDKPIKNRYSCSVADMGTETLTIVERSYTTRHMREECTGPQGSFANDFWFQSGGKLRKSRQWISQDVGYVLIQHLSE